MSALVLRRHSGGLPTELARAVARLHVAATDHDFLSSLGEPFLTSLYEGLASSRSAFVITATYAGELLGFICGVTSTRRAYLDFMLSRRSPWAALRLLPKLASLSTARRVTETLLSPAREAEVPLPAAEILNFCVSEARRGQGVGRRLFEALLAEFARRSVREIRIVTGADQVSARIFYDRIGAQRAAELENHEGKTSIVYTYSIPRAGGERERSVHGTR